MDHLEELVRNACITGTKRRTAVAHGEPRDEKHPRYLEHTIPVEEFSDGPVLVAVQGMLPGHGINRVTLTQNWASTAHNDVVNEGDTHVVLFGEWIGGRLNEMNGPVRFLLPEGGVSMLDAPGQPFFDPEADNALFEAIEKTVRISPTRRVERVAGNINDETFVTALVTAFQSVAPKMMRSA